VPAGNDDACLAHHLTLRAYGVRFRLRASSPALLDTVRTVAPPLAVPTEATTRVREFGVRGSSRRCDCGRRHDGFDVFEAGRAMASYQNEADALDFLGGTIKAHVAGTAPRYVVVHAGVVEVGGRAIVLPGRSHSGKTTLVAALVAAGATYYSDDCAVIDRRGLVHPYPQPLGMRSATRIVQVQTPIDVLGGRAGTTPVPIALVAAMTFRGEISLSVEPMRPAETALSLFEHTFGPRRDPATTMRALGAAARLARGLRGSRGDAADAAAALLAAI
jgi:hypothetical protein